MRRALYVLGQLSDQNIEWMITQGQRERVPPGTALIEEGGPSDVLYIVLDGALGIYIDVDGRETQIAQRGVGDILGDMSFIEDRPASATVKAVEESILYSIPKAELAARLEHDRDFAARFYRGIAISMSYRLRESMEQAAPGKEDMTDGEIDESEELDPTVLDSIYLAGLRFDRIVRRMME
jgi:CRP-like cAMP-binding protein